MLVFICSEFSKGPSLRKCTGDGTVSYCSKETQLVKVLLGFNLDECKDACRDDPDCQGGYHANGRIKKSKSKRLHRYDAACYLLGVEGADEKPCNVPNTLPATEFDHPLQPTTESADEGRRKCVYDNMG